MRITHILIWEREGREEKKQETYLVKPVVPIEGRRKSSEGREVTLMVW